MATQKTHRQLLAITSRTPWASFCGDLSRSLLSPERDTVRHQPHLRIFTETPLGAGFPANLEPIQGRIVPHPSYFYHLRMWPWLLCTVFLLLWLYFFGTSQRILVFRSMYSISFPIRSHFVHYVEDFVINPKFSYLLLLQYIAMDYSQFQYASPTLFCRLCLHWSLPLLSTFRETLRWAILVWESKILATPLFSIAFFICWNGSHFCLWGCSWR